MRLLWSIVKFIVGAILLLAAVALFGWGGMLAIVGIIAVFRAWDALFEIRDNVQEIKAFLEVERKF